MSNRKLNDDIIITSRLNDPHYIACINARESMKTPCNWRQNDFGSAGQRACWMGHLLNHLYGVDDYKDWPERWTDESEVVARKLGFHGALQGGCPSGELYVFNDEHDHQTVLEEFDIRMENWPNGYKG